MADEEQFAEYPGSLLACERAVIRRDLRVGQILSINGGPYPFPSGGSFALIDYEWQGDNVLASTNIAMVSRPVAPNGNQYVGIRDFTFASPIDDVDRAVITATVSSSVLPPLIPEPPALPGPPGFVAVPLGVWGELLNPLTLRVVVYRSFPFDFPLTGPIASLSEEAVRVFVNVARVDA
jgi:hypothetical protein